MLNWWSMKGLILFPYMFTVFQSLLALGASATDMERDFSVVRPEELSLAQQIRCFLGAEAVVAPHGGGLANLVFCSPPCRVIELFPAANIDLYYRLSRVLGLGYHYVKATSGDREKLGLEDYQVPLDALKRALEAADLRRTAGSGIG